MSISKSGREDQIEDFSSSEFLKEKFAKEVLEKKLILLNEDILNFTLGSSFSGSLSGLGSPAFTLGSSACESPQKGKPSVSSNYKIIANIPYNITGAILKKFLTEKHQPSMMVLMVQNEVAKRIVGRRDNPTSQKLRGARESILSISVKAYGEPKMITKVPARYFSPAPKVDSAVILIKNIGREFFVKNKIDENNFWETVHAGFAHKRKKLSGNLKKFVVSSPGTLLEKYKDKRAEDLSLEDWVSIVQKI